MLGVYKLFKSISLIPIPPTYPLHFLFNCMLTLNLFMLIFSISILVKCLHHHHHPHLMGVSRRTLRPIKAPLLVPSLSLLLFWLFWWYWLRRSLFIVVGKRIINLFPIINPFPHHSMHKHSLTNGMSSHFTRIHAFKSLRICVLV